MREVVRKVDVEEPEVGGEALRMRDLAGLQQEFDWQHGKGL